MSILIWGNNNRFQVSEVMAGIRSFFNVVCETRLLYNSECHQVIFKEEICWRQLKLGWISQFYKWIFLFLLSFKRLWDKKLQMSLLTFMEVRTCWGKNRLRLKQTFGFEQKNLLLIFNYWFKIHMYMNVSSWTFSRVNKLEWNCQAVVPQKQSMTRSVCKGMHLFVSNWGHHFNNFKTLIKSTLHSPGLIFSNWQTKTLQKIFALTLLICSNNNFFRLMVIIGAMLKDTGIRVASDVLLIEGIVLEFLNYLEEERSNLFTSRNYAEECQNSWFNQYIPSGFSLGRFIM